MKVYIRANSPYGLPVAARAGRQFPTGRTVEVEIVDGDKEPTVDVASGAGTTAMPDPARMTKKSLEEIKKDPRFSVLENPKSEEDLGAARAELDQKNRRIAELEKRLADLEGTGDKTHPGGEDEHKSGARATKR